MNIIKKENFDFVIVGGGMSGVCAAIEAARSGLKTALVQNRPVLGGNASSEIRMHICGADRQMENPNYRETGIIEELLLENKRRNPEMNYPIWDSVLWEKTKYEENLTTFLNCHMDRVNKDGDTIKNVHVIQMTSGKEYSLEAPYFADMTGDGTLSDLSGAIFRVGREARDEFGESLAPAEADHYTMGSTLLFQAEDKGYPVKFVRPSWAYEFSEIQLAKRDHRSITSGYWWVELGGTKLDIIEDAEEIRDELVKTVFGIWDHIKNTGNHDAENFDLTWMGYLPGKRESRRVEGDYILTQKDIDQSRIFPDAVAYGGWTMDLHISDGLLNEKEEPTVWNPVSEYYSIPYRCLYSRNVNNLFIGGRLISCSHVAFSSTRVMGTCSVVGQAVGAAAYIANKYSCNPREVNSHINELQQHLIKNDCFIPGQKNKDQFDLARSAGIRSSSYTEDNIPEKLINGITRNIHGEKNFWEVNLDEDKDATVYFDLHQEQKISEIRLTFDSNLSREITPSINKEVIGNQVKFSPPELVAEFSITLKLNGDPIYTRVYQSNGQRHINIPIDLDSNIDQVEIKIISTYGDPLARIFEVRIY